MKTGSYRTQKRTLIAAGVVLAAYVSTLPLQAQTKAYWNFEEGTAGANVDRGGQADGVFYGSILDQSGNGYNMSTWSDGAYAGYVYRDITASSVIPLSGAPNTLSVKNTGGFPAMWTETGTTLQTWEPSAWTIEATFKLENGGYRTIIGRDSQGAATSNGDLAALYFQAVPNNGLAIKFADVEGYWHEAISPDNIFMSFDFPSDNDGTSVPWYSMAAVSDGSMLSLYLRNVTDSSGWDLIAQTDLTLSGSADTTLTMGTGDGGDWDAGNFSVGRGLYAGGHGDRAWGFMDEVRFSDGALMPSEFLYVPEPTTAALAALGLGSVLLALRRRRQS